MDSGTAQNERIRKMTFASVYPHYLAKVEKKGRSKQELHIVIHWLTGFGDQEIMELIAENITFETFFDRARIHPNARLIKGLICGYRIQEIENPLTQKVRMLDKLVDDLAKGKKLEKFLNSF